MAFKERLKEARLRKGYSQELLAGKVGVAKSTFTGYEKGYREPSIPTITKILEALDIDADFLWQDETSLPFELTYDELENLVKKYRGLDAHGKEMVDFTLRKEYERSMALKKQPGQKITSVPEYIIADAAHQRTDISIPENIDTSDNDIMDDENF